MFTQQAVPRLRVHVPAGREHRYRHGDPLLDRGSCWVTIATWRKHREVIAGPLTGQCGDIVAR